MLNASKTLKFCLAITLIAMGAGVDFSLNMSTQSQSPSSEKNVASRYHLRSRTPNFFSRSKTATTPTPQAAPTQPVVRRG